MRINFALPAYTPLPVGGYRVVFEYANWLAARGHEINVVARLVPVSFLRRFPATVSHYLWPSWTWLKSGSFFPWQTFHPRVRVLLSPSLSGEAFPDADATIATAWETAQPVRDLPASKGIGHYLIQHYETWSGEKEKVEATWRFPLRKIIISRWLYELGEQLGATDMLHIPNGIDHNVFRVLNPPGQRRLSILSLYHHAAFKGVPHALAALVAYHELYPEVPISMFGTVKRGSEIPDWIHYHENPTGDRLIRLYNDHAIYLAASLSEGWALPPAEAMACGCAFIGTDIGGFRDYSIHDETALLSPPGEPEAMLENLVAATLHQDLLRRIQRAGTSNIRQFTWERSGAAIEAHLIASAQLHSPPHIEGPGLLIRGHQRTD